MGHIWFLVAIFGHIRAIMLVEVEVRSEANDNKAGRELVWGCPLGGIPAWLRARLRFAVGAE